MGLRCVRRRTALGRALLGAWFVCSVALGGAGIARAQSAPALQIDAVRTADGVRLGVARLERPGAVPVVLLHGIGANLEEFLVPGRSFGEHLWRAGYDVWLANFRYAGTGALASEDRGDASFDALVVRDLPAVLAHVEARTGRRPFLIGHSMGGMVALAWASGAVLRSAAVTLRPRWRGGTLVWERVYAPRIEIDPAVAAARGLRVRGVVALASPARFDWPLVVPRLERDLFWDYNFLLTSMAWSPAARAAALVLDRVPASVVARWLTDDLTSLPHVGPALRLYLRWVATRIGNSMLSAYFMLPGSMDSATIYRALDRALDDFQGGALRQFMDGIRVRDMREAHTLDPLRAPTSYADGQRWIRAPVLWVAGRYDKLANDDTIELAVAALGTPDRQFLRVEHGHLDLVLGDRAPRDVWPVVTRWLAQH